jgi:hypothetical protein
MSPEEEVVYDFVTELSTTGKTAALESLIRRSRHPPARPTRIAGLNHEQIPPMSFHSRPMKLF